jgi:hypothetical protein
MVRRPIHGSSAMSNSTPAAKPWLFRRLDLAARDAASYMPLLFGCVGNFLPRRRHRPSPEYPSPFGTADQFGLAKVGGLLDQFVVALISENPGL